MSRPARQLYEFGPFRLDPVEQQLLRDGDPIALTPKAFETLLTLVENSRHIVSKDELMRRVWPDTYVEETNLAQNISTIRKTLGERPDGGQYIETIPKRGYRFVLKAKKIRQEATGPLPDPSQIEKPEADDEPVRRELKAKTTSAEKTRTTGARAELITPGMRLGRYEILSQLGAGGMGEVYLARDLQLDRKVALKLLSERFTKDARSLRRFIREAKAASALNHPNILTVYEIRDEDGVHFIATEFIEGKTLREIIKAGPIELSIALDIAQQVAGALAAAHVSGIIHRDVKPENIMVRPDGYVKILDFGVAKLIGPQALIGSEEKATTGIHTDSGLIMGTLDYMSPEQARGLPVDSRSDLFSLGAVLYEMIAGRAPFTGPSKSDIIVNLLNSDPPPLANYTSGVPPTIDALVRRLLIKDYVEREAVAEKLQRELRELKQEFELSTRRVTEIMRPVSVSPIPVELAPLRGPEIHYALSGDVNIAYQVIGDAPLDLVFVMGWVSHLEYFWAEPLLARFLSRLASFSRLILFDKRGTGLSDRVPLNELPTLEQRMDDVRAVMDAVGSEQAVLCGVSEGGPMCSLFAATYPEKVTALVMIGTYAKRIWAPDYPWAPTVEARAHFYDEIRNHWGGPVGIEDRAPSLANDPQFREWWATYLRMGASPGAALALTQMNAEIDVRHVLPTIRVPSLILHRTEDACLRIEEGRYVASRIPGAKLVELPGADHLPFVGDQEAILDEIEEFLTGVRHAEARDTMLVTVLATRITTGEVSGDIAARHREHARRELELFKGREIERTENGMIAIFDGPARAIRAACAISDSARRLGLGLQAGLHTGECEVVGEEVSGLALKIGVQIACRAVAGEVLVSSTVKDLVAGSGLRFAERGAHHLPGIADEWNLYTVAR
jgi:serine/threonine protein kinase/DNA-binding winged helix-turn-helix (wHTH) protein/alpha-beta hydrolase superfamily lysophospholipase